jgi:MFS transporter, UMF1 family
MNQQSDLPPTDSPSPVASPPPPSAADTRPVDEHVITKRAVVSWVLYDLANTIFSMGVISLFFPLWIREAVGGDRADTVFGIIQSISMAIIFVASPLAGAMTDRAARRMPFLMISTLICVTLTALLARAGFYLTAILFVLANVAYQAGLQFYDALLPEVSTGTNRGKVGGLGVGFGYFGSYIAVGLGLLFGTQNKPLLFLMIALAFLVFAIPCMLFVKERGNPNPRPINLEMVRNSTHETLRTLRSGQQYPGLLRFLIGRVFYTDAINTVISFMSLYTVSVAVHSGLSNREGETRAQLILMSAITFAVVGGFFWGWLTDRLGPKRALNHVLCSWMAIFFVAGLVGILGLPLWMMYAVAAAAGFSLGGVWAADRPYMLRLTPPDRIGEFYGLYGMVGRFSAITGPMLWALVTWLAVHALRLKPLVGQGISVLVLLVFIVASYLILRPISDEARVWERDR